MNTQISAPICNNEPYIQWIYIFFGQCVSDWQECLSLCLGYLSILCWLNAQMPQVLKNYRLQTADSLSFTFLVVWLTGDVANFIGCILTGQMSFQVYLSIYFIAIDTALCIQWLYYVKFPDNRLRQWFVGKQEHVTSTERTPLLTARSGNNLSTASDVHQKKATGSAARALLMIGFMFVLSSPLHLGPQGTQPLTSNTEPMMVAQEVDSDLWVGRFFAWLCTALYLASRLPQIWHNFFHRSVDGLSMALFLCAAAGNLTYTLSIFTNPHQTRQSLLEAVPYILGSAGTLLFDLTIYIQYRLYNTDTPEKSQLPLTVTEEA
ncbi:PQ loop repeat-domain-containing protein [Syncephalastrum racemosum]|uniref:PQ loop repeat-domain-containing protein n=1 Tax=Syncephalastrum racemosum TaxID=13706 RepID=A0A1X2HHH2_SYNRA|nr:PQ loop repeat-domain-containing protein [Syncephalastrum racemosum]